METFLGSLKTGIHSGEIHRDFPEPARRVEVVTGGVRFNEHGELIRVLELVLNDDRDAFLIDDDVVLFEDARCHKSGPATTRRRHTAWGYPAAPLS